MLTLDDLPPEIVLMICARLELQHVYMCRIASAILRTYLTPVGARDALASVGASGDIATACCALDARPHMQVAKAICAGAIGAGNVCMLRWCLAVINALPYATGVWHSLVPRATVPIADATIAREMLLCAIDSACAGGCARSFIHVIDILDSKKNAIAHGDIEYMRRASACLRVFKRLHTRGFSATSECLRSAPLEVIAYANNQMCAVPTWEQLKSPGTDVTEWYLRRGRVSRTRVLTLAESAGDMRTLQWLVDRGDADIAELLLMSTYHGNAAAIALALVHATPADLVNALERALAHRYPVASTVLPLSEHARAYIDHMSADVVAEWNCRGTRVECELQYRSAAECGDMHALSVLQYSGGRISYSFSCELYSVAARCDRPRTAKWLRRQVIEPSASVFAEAVRWGSKRMIEWCAHVRAPFDSCVMQNLLDGGTMRRWSQLYVTRSQDELRWRIR